VNLLLNQIVNVIISFTKVLIINFHILNKEKLIIKNKININFQLENTIEILDLFTIMDSNHNINNKKDQDHH